MATGKEKSSLAITNEFTPVEYDPQYILMVNALKKYFPIKDGLIAHTVGYVKAVDGVTFNLKRGTTMGLVGESGCGKTTVGKTLLNLVPKTSGDVIFNGNVQLDQLSPKELRAFRPKIQIIFQPKSPPSSIVSSCASMLGTTVARSRLVFPIITPALWFTTCCAMSKIPMTIFHVFVTIKTAAKVLNTHLKNIKVSMSCILFFSVTIWISS